MNAAICCKSDNCLAIAGNHDEAAVADDAARQFQPTCRPGDRMDSKQLTQKNRAYLARLPRELHFPYVRDRPRSAHVPLPIHSRRDRCAERHSSESKSRDLHWSHACGGGLLSRMEQRPSRLPKRTFHQRLSRGGRIEVAPQFRYIINPGSVGQPRDRNPQASFALFDDAASVVEIRRVTYDVMRVREQMESVELPPELAERLSLGY